MSSALSKGLSGSADAAALRQRDMQQEQLSYGERVINWYSSVLDSVTNFFAPGNEPLQQATPTDIVPEASADILEDAPVLPAFPAVVPEGNFVIEATEAPTEGATEGATEGETTGASE